MYILIQFNQPAASFQWMHITKTNNNKTVTLKLLMNLGAQYDEVLLPNDFLKHGWLNDVELKRVWWLCCGLEMYNLSVGANVPFKTDNSILSRISAKNKQLRDS